MKIRCKNCFKVLQPNEEYCTHCGEHSEEIAKVMKEKNKDLDSMAKFKLALILFLSIAFLGTGVFTVTFTLIFTKTTSYQWEWIKTISSANSILITSASLFLVLIILYNKELKKMFFNGNLQQLLGSIIVGVLVGAIIIVMSKLTPYTKLIPSYMTNYLSGGERYLPNGGGINIWGLYISMILVSICEEIILRKRVIDMLDDETLLGDKAIIVVATLISTFLDFIWIMSLETVIMMTLLNVTLSAIYMYTNRSIGVNVILRIILITIIFII